MKENESKNSAPNGPEGQLSMSRRRAVQCRPLKLVPRLRDLGALEQGKYEEERKKSLKDGGAPGEYIGRHCRARAPSCCLGLQFQAALADASAANTL